MPPVVRPASIYAFAALIAGMAAAALAIEVGLIAAALFVAAVAAFGLAAADAVRINRRNGS